MGLHVGRNAIEAEHFLGRAGARHRRAAREEKLPHTSTNYMALQWSDSISGSEGALPKEGGCRAAAGA